MDNDDVIDAVAERVKSKKEKEDEKRLREKVAQIMNVIDAAKRINSRIDRIHDPVGRHCCTLNNICLINDMAMTALLCQSADLPEDTQEVLRKFVEEVRHSIECRRYAQQAARA